MNPAEHLAVLVSIILGLALAELLTRVRQLVRARQRVRFHWLPVAWAGGIFLTLVQAWWAMFRMLQHPVWTNNFFSFFFLLAVPVLLYLLASSVLPDVETEEVLDLRAYYLQERTWFFLLLAALVVVSVATELLRGMPLLRTSRVVHAVQLVGALVLARSGNLALHAVLTVVALSLLLLFVALYTLRIA